MESRIKKLEALIPGKSKAARTRCQNKHMKKFEKEAYYVCEGVYAWGSIQAPDTRELFLKGLLAAEGIDYTHITG